MSKFHSWLDQFGLFSNVSCQVEPNILLSPRPKMEPMALNGTASFACLASPLVAKGKSQLWGLGLGGKPTLPQKSAQFTKPPPSPLQMRLVWEAPGPIVSIRGVFISGEVTVLCVPDCGKGTLALNHLDDLGFPWPNFYVFVVCFVCNVYNYFLGHKCLIPDGAWSYMIIHTEGRQE